MSALIPNDGWKTKPPKDANQKTPEPGQRLLVSVKAGPEGWASLRFLLTVLVAGAADALEVAFPPLFILFDAVAIFVLLALWGWRWEIAMVLIPEVIPGLDLFPTWTALAFYLGAKGIPNKPAAMD